MSVITKQALNVYRIIKRREEKRREEKRREEISQRKITCGFGNSKSNDLGINWFMSFGDYNSHGLKRQAL